MRILLTGATGFLGSQIITQLSSHDITTVGRNSDIEFDFKHDNISLPKADCVIHVAGKAHSLPRNLSESKEFFDVNVKGMSNLLSSLENSSLPKSFLFISSVAVYGLDKGKLIDERYPLLATDPYGLSKIQAEKLLQEWCVKHNIICTIFRLPLIMGPQAKGNLATMIKGIRNNYYFNIAGGKTRKSMVLAQDVIQIIPDAIQYGGIYNLTDGCHPSFYELSMSIAKKLNITGIKNIPMWLAILMAKIGDLIGKKSPFNTYKLKKIVSELTFDDAKARSTLHWRPRSVIEHLQINK